MISGIVIRPATPSDAGLLAEMRVRSATTRRPGGHDADVAAFMAASEAAFASQLRDRTLRAWIAFDRERAVGSASLMLLPALPRMRQVRPVDGRIRSVFVDPEYRRRGIALALMREAIAEAEREQVDRLVLGTSDEGRPLYERLGFTAKEDEMMFGED